MKIAVFCPNLIGDTVMATPTFRALRQGFPAATIVGVIKPQVAPTLDGDPVVRRLDLFRPRIAATASTDHGGHAPAAPREVSTSRFSCPIRFGLRGWPGWPASPRRVGYVRYGRGMLADRPAVRTARRVGRTDPDADRRSRISSWPGSSAARSTRYGSSWPRRPSDEAAADRAFASLGAGRRAADRLLEHRRSIRSGQELARAAFRRAGAATGRRRRTCRSWSCAGPTSASRRERSWPRPAIRRVVSLADQPLGSGSPRPACAGRRS